MRLSTVQSIGSLGLFAIIGLCLAAVSEGLRVEWERAVTAEKQKAILLRELRHRTKNEFCLGGSNSTAPGEGSGEQRTTSSVGLSHKQDRNL
jgi:hypothetical protein